MKKINFTPFLILTFFLLVAITIVTSSIKIKRVSIEPENFSCGEAGEINKIINLSNQNFFTLDSQEVKNLVTKNYLCIERVEIKKTFPDKIKITLISRKPSAVVIPFKEVVRDSLELVEASASSAEAKLDFSIPQASEGGFLADISGFVYSKATNVNSLPIINLADEEIKLGEFIKNGVVRVVVDILNEINKVPINLRTIKIINDEILIDADTKLAFSLKKDYYRQLASLQLILEKAKMNSSQSSSQSSDIKKVERIDLRFDKPIVVYGRR